MRHKNGASSHLVASFDALTANAASIACREGRIGLPAPLFGAEEVVVDKFSPAGSSNNASESKLKTTLKQNPLLRRLKAALASGGEHHPYGASQYLPQMLHFINLIASEKSESDIATHDLSLSVLRIIDQMRASKKG